LFDREFESVVDWAESNRAAIQSTIEKQIGATELLMDLPHNTYEKLDDGVVIRKGSIRLKPGELSILPSHMSGDVSLVSATDRIAETLFSMSHGTGRTMSRSDAKDTARTFDFESLRRQVIMPSFLNPASLNTEGPFAYRNLDDCLALIEGYAVEVKRFSVVAYMGHL
jgi:RNA-splicing ligase RtcB